MEESSLAYSVTDPFYAFHILTFLSYFIARQSATATASPVFCNHLLRRELQATLCLAVIMCMKSVKCISNEAFWADAVLYGKGVLFLLSCILDRRLAAWYLVIFAVIFLLFQQPPYRGLGKVLFMTPLQLENQLLEGTSSKLWLVEFRASWSTRCIHASRMFADLSLRYSTEDFHFASIDVGRFPKVAENYNIALGVSMGHLPTYVLFEHSAEISRLPELNFEGKAVIEDFSKGMVAKYFELDRHFLSYLYKASSKRA